MATDDNAERGQNKRSGVFWLVCYALSGVRARNEAAGNSVTVPGENGVTIETDDGRVTNTTDYYIGLYGESLPRLISGNNEGLRLRIHPKIKAIFNFAAS